MMTGNITDLTGMTFIPPKPTRGASDGVSHSLPILIGRLGSRGCRLSFRCPLELIGY